MKIDIYETENSPEPRAWQYVMIESETDRADDVVGLPPDVAKKVGRLSFFKTITIQPGEKRIALDADEAISNIKRQGYHIQCAKIETGVVVPNRQ